MAAPFQSIPIMHLDLTSPRGRQCIQDALDQLVAMFAGGRIDAKHLKPALREVVSAVSAPMRACYLLSAPQSINNDTSTFVAWDTKVASFRLPDATDGGIVFPPEAAGKRFRCVLNVRWAPGATGYRQIDLSHWGSQAGVATRKKAGNDIRMAVTTATLNTDQNVVLVTDPIEPGDSIKALVRHTQGAALSMGVGNGAGTFQHITSLTLEEI
jgi:hypothetical protein